MDAVVQNAIQMRIDSRNTHTEGNRRIKDDYPKFIKVCKLTFNRIGGFSQPAQDRIRMKLFGILEDAKRNVLNGRPAFIGGQVETEEGSDDEGDDFVATAEDPPIHFDEDAEPSETERTAEDDDDDNGGSDDDDDDDESGLPVKYLKDNRFREMGPESPIFILGPAQLAKGHFSRRSNKVIKKAY